NHVINKIIFDYLIKKNKICKNSSNIYLNESNKNSKITYQNTEKNCFSGVNNNRIFEKENKHDKTETIIIIDDEENVNEYQNTEKNCFSDVNSNRAIEERNKRNRTETIIIIDDEENVNEYQNTEKNCFSDVNSNRAIEERNKRNRTETIIIDDDENENEYQNTEKNCFSDVNSNRAIEERNKRNSTETIIIIEDENENKRLKLNNNNRHLRYHYNERNNNNSNSTLYTIDCMFDNDIIKAYLFNENFDIKKYVNINNVNMIDRYKNLILYYALLKEDKYSILYLLSIDSDKFINLISSENIITGIIFFNIKGILNKIFKSCRSRNLKDYFSDVNSNTELFKIIICNRQSHLYDKFDFIDCIDYYINIHKLKFHINPLVMGMMIEKEEESEKMVHYLLSKEFKIDDFDNALLYSIKLNLKLFKKLKENSKLTYLKLFIDYTEENFISNLLKYSIILDCYNIINIMINNRLKNIETEIYDDDNNKVSLWKYASQQNNVKMENYLKEVHIKLIRNKRSKNHVVERINKDN
ncbi:hypothetical protein BCR36DRAFT_440536, partial [Piromyces finnis]